jgi:membrane protein DedA with SNARE-associated domain
MNTATLALLAEWGEPFLFVLLFFAALGLPLPATLSLIAAGALTTTGVIDGYSTVIWSVCGAVLGDHAGYLVGRIAGPAIQARLERRPTVARRFATARAKLTERGIAGIFLSRWLFTPLGPPVNIAAGIAAFPLARFSLADIAGEIVWVALYFSIGAFAGAGVEELSQAASDFSWLALAAAVTAVLGWAAFRRRPKSAGD